MICIYNYNHEIEIPTDIAMKKFLWADYFHDSIISNINFESTSTGQVPIRNILKLTLQCDRDCNNFCSKHNTIFKDNIASDTFTYFLYFTGVEYVHQECDMASMIYLNGRFKSTQKLREIAFDKACSYYHFRIQNTNGFMDIVFKGFKIRKKKGRVSYNVDGYDFTSFVEPIAPKEKQRIDKTFDGELDEWDCLEALEKLYISNDPDLLKYARICLYAVNAEIEDAKVYAAYLLGNIGDKTDLPVITKLYAKTQFLLQKKHLEDALEVLRKKGYEDV